MLSWGGCCFGRLTIIIGLPANNSHAGSMTIQSSGSNVVLGTTTAAIKRLNQPSRVTTSTMPRIAQETVIAAGTAGTCSCSINPNATPDKHCREDSPTAKATGGSNHESGKFNHRQQKVIAGAESLICHHLLHLIQPFKQRNWSTHYPPEYRE